MSKLMREKTHEFNYLDRKNILSIFLKKDEKESPSVQLETGKKIMIPAGINNKKTLLKISNELRRFIYRKLVEYGYDDTSNIIVIVDGPEGVNRSSKISFVGANIMWPNKYGLEFKDNETFAKELIEFFQNELKRLEADYEVVE